MDEAPAHSRAGARGNGRPHISGHGRAAGDPGLGDLCCDRPQRQCGTVSGRSAPASSLFPTPRCPRGPGWAALCLGLLCRPPRRGSGPSGRTPGHALPLLENATACLQTQGQPDPSFRRRRPELAAPSVLRRSCGRTERAAGAGHGAQEPAVRGWWKTRSPPLSTHRPVRTAHPLCAGNATQASSRLRPQGSAQTG